MTNDDGGETAIDNDDDDGGGTSDDDELVSYMLAYGCWSKEEGREESKQAANAWQVHGENEAQKHGICISAQFSDSDAPSIVLVYTRRTLPPSSTLHE